MDDDWEAWNGIRDCGDHSEIVNDRDEVLVTVHGEYHRRDARRLFALHDQSDGNPWTVPPPPDTGAMS